MVARSCDYPDTQKELTILSLIITEKCLLINTLNKIA